MPKQSQEIVTEAIPNAVEAFYSQTREELEAPINFQEAIERSGLSEEEIVVITSYYELVKDKSDLVDVPFFIRAVRFSVGDMSEFVIVRAVTENNRMVVFTDGSTGIYQQLKVLTEQRLASGHATPFENFLCANGLRVSTYYVEADGTPAAKGRVTKQRAKTYYLA